ncbi:RNA N6-adenosine-methyltransferase METTL16-like [Salvelinus namaycush]|uniref:RNA N6-adenosine-methyltransferase METTL16-like n=1 Tax=Salvelinus namaycush TaxID=8040 RepID=A0A8U0P316_SALNM|nr:RNA N6-adenosine-methyltransferase METTL16-like [Salvelinus namaycush]
MSTPTWVAELCTGASCIYPLLGASMNGWHYLATEVDDICFDYATRNVEQNNLSDLKVVKVPQKTLLMDALKEESAIVYDFCMCNPPFSANQLEAKGVNSRNSRRPPPSSVNTGGVTEIMAEGGELEFVKRIIHDSLQLKTRLRLPTVRRGNWRSLVSHCPSCCCSPRPPLQAVPPTPGLWRPSLPGWRRHSDLKVLHKRVPCGRKEQSLFLTAVENTWIHRDQGPHLRAAQSAPPQWYFHHSFLSPAPTEPAALHTSHIAHTQIYTLPRQCSTVRDQQGRWRQLSGGQLCPNREQRNRRMSSWSLVPLQHPISHWHRWHYSPRHRTPPHRKYLPKHRKRKSVPLDRK